MAESLPPQEKNKINLESSNPFWALKKAAKYEDMISSFVNHVMWDLCVCVCVVKVAATLRFVPPHTHDSKQSLCSHPPLHTLSPLQCLVGSE